MTTPVRKPSTYTLAIRSLTKAFKSFGPRGKFWMQGDYGRDMVTNKRFDAKQIAKVRTVHPLKLCSMGAILRADGPGEAVAVKLLAEVITDGVNFGASGADSVIIRFNDNPNTAFKDIRKMFNKAIRTAEMRRADEVRTNRKLRSK